MRRMGMVTPASQWNISRGYGGSSRLLTCNQSIRRGFFLFAQGVLPLLVDAVATSPHPPSLIVTGATASLRGSAQMSSFASGKFALRATTQSLAREFGPQGVHVAHAIIDGVIDIPRTKDWLKDAGPDAKIDADAVSYAVSVVKSMRLKC